MDIISSKEKIEVEKKSKRGLKTVDIRQGIKSYDIKEMLDCAVLEVVLSAGSSDNVNPNLLVTALEAETGLDYNLDITRNDLFNSDMELFR